MKHCLSSSRGKLLSVFSMSVFGIFTYMTIGCTHSSIESTVVEIDCTKEVYNSDIFDSLFNYNSYVILEDTENSKISNIDKVYVSDDKIVILDNRTRILIFSQEGKFVKSIEHRGHGNGEYLSLNDFIVKGDSLYCLDRLEGKVLVYSLDGNFLYSKEVPPSKGFLFLNNGIALNKEFGMANGRERDYYCYSYIENNEVRNEIKYNKALNGRSFSTPSGSNGFYMSEENIYYCLPYSDTIYEINKETGNLSPVVRILLGDRVIQERDEEKRVMEILSSSVPSNIFAFYKWSNILAFSYYGEDDVRQYVFYDLKKGLLHNAPLGFDKNHIPVSIMSYDNYRQGEYRLLCSISPITVRTLCKKQSDKDVNPLLQELNKKILNNDNPILVFYNILNP